MAIHDPIGRPPGAGDVPPNVESLRRSLTDLVAESQALRVDVNSAETARRRANTINLTAVGLLLLFVVMISAVSWQNNQLAKQVNRTNDRMADCTTPGGTCYETSQRRVSGAIADIVRASVFMNQCARLWPNESGPDYDRKLEKCVNDRLAQAARNRQDNPSPRPSG